MAIELATAYVSISASAGGIGKSIVNELGVGEKAVSSSSARMSSSLASAFKGVAGAVVGIGATVVGLALGGGIARALAIDKAESNMKSLGYSTDQVKSVMNSALTSVQGTMFGLGDAAGLASQLIAAGIQPGQDLSRALGLTADMASVAGTSLGDLSPVMAGLASSGRLYTEDLLQLQQRNIPVFKWLAESLGTTQDNVKNMVSAGKVSFAQLETAIQQHIGGAAKANDSFAGSLANLRTAVSKVGALFATPALPLLKTIMDSARVAVDELSKRVTPFVTVLTARLGPIVDSLAPKIKALFDGNMFAGLSGLAPILAPLAGLILAIGSSSLASAFAPLGLILPKISGPMGLLVGALGYMLATSAPLRAALGDVFSTLGSAVVSLAPVFASLGPVIGQLAGTLGNVLAKALEAILPLFVVVVAAVGTVLDVLKNVIGWVQANQDWLGPLAVSVGVLVAGFKAYGIVMATIKLATEAWAVVQGALNVVMAMNPIGLIIIAVAALVAGLIWFFTQTKLGREVWANVWGFIQSTAQAVATWFTGTLVPWFTAVWAGLQAGLQAVGAFFAAVWTGIVTTVQGVLGFLGQVIAAMLAPIQAAWQFFWGTFGGLITAVWNFIVVAVQLAVALVQLVVTTAWGVIQTVTSAAWNAISAVISAVWGAIVATVSAAAAAVWGAISPVLSTIQSAWSAAWNAVAAIIGPIWANITSAVSGAIGNVLSTVSGLQSQLVGFFSGAGTWLLSAGRSIVQGLINGITGMISGATGAMSDLLAKVQALLPHSPALEGPFSGKGWTLYSGQAMAKALGAGIDSTQSIPVAAARRLVSATRGALDIGTNPSISGSASPNTAGLLSSAAGASAVAEVLATLKRMEGKLDGAELRITGANALTDAMAGRLVMATQRRAGR
jgi:tape measure domain-containing protein